MASGLEDHGLVNAGTWPYADGPSTYTSGAPTCSRSLVRSPGAARRPVSIVYRVEAVLESCLGRGYVPESKDLDNLLLISLKRAIRW